MPGTWSVIVGSAFVLLLVAANARASSLFDSSAVLQVRLTGPLRQLIEQKYDREEMQFVLHAEGEHYTIAVRTRGNSRLRKCNFPPLRLAFNAANTAGGLFEGQGKLKLVTHCLPGVSGRMNVLKEYTAYRIFNLLSDVGYRVRLLKINYDDTDDEHKDITTNAFLIESDEELAARTGATIARVPQVRRTDFDQLHLAVVFIFQYLIANTDYSLVASAAEDKCCHNGDLFERDGRLYYVPFDFDLSGLVNARYAKPDPALGISKVTSRRYRGYCVDPGAMSSALKKINTLEAEILDIVSGTPGMVEKGADEVRQFLGRFFKEANDEGRLLGRFAKACI